MEEKISLGLWREYALGENTKGYKTDQFYYKLANDIYQKLSVSGKGSLLPLEPSSLLSVRLSQYVEDVISGLGIFKAFRSLNQSFDNRPLPFYDVSPKADVNDASNSEDGLIGAQNNVYNPKSLNVEDIQLLLWDYAMAYNLKREILSPFDSEFERIAQDVKTVMDQAFKEAPVNVELLEWLYPKEKFSTFDQLRERLAWMCQGCYLSVSYHYSKDLTALKNKVIEAEEPMTESKTFKLTVTETKESFIESLLFQKTTRLLSLPYHNFYAHLLKEADLKENAQVAKGLDGYIFQEYRVISDHKGRMVIQGADEKIYEIEVPKDFYKQVKNPGFLRFVMCSLVRFDGKWQMRTCRKYSYDSDFLGHDDGWDRDIREYSMYRERAKITAESVLNLQKQNSLGFYRNPQVLSVDVMERNNLKMVQNLEQLRNKTPDLNQKRQLTQEIGSLTKELKFIKKRKSSIKAGSPLSPVVVIVHDDDSSSVYRDGVSNLQVESNPFARTAPHTEATIEYKIMHDFDHDLVVAVLRDPTIKVTKNSTEGYLPNVRQFIVDNAEFISRYGYHDCFTGISSMPYNYPPESGFVL